MEVKSLAVEVECPTSEDSERADFQTAFSLKPLPIQDDSLASIPAPHDLLVEFMDQPLGMDQYQPHFSWKLGSAIDDRLAPGDFQAKYEVLVGDASGALWYSGLVASTTPSMTPPGPLRLQSDHVYHWSVRVTAADGSVSLYSKQASFTTGLFSQGDWSARWIGGGKIFRRDFALPVQPGRVSIFVSACQYYQLHLDGGLVGNNVLDVGWTNFPTNRSYTSYNVSPSLLGPGCHTVGLMIGQGFCGQYTALVQIHFHRASDDSVFMVLGSDSTWSASSGPVLADSTYYGETYDARHEQVCI
jgi:alpha-L-rhamnosidase